VCLVRLVCHFLKRTHYPHELAVQLSNACLDEPVKASPLAAMAQRNQIFLTHDELFFELVVQWLDVTKPSTEAPVVALRWSLERIEFAALYEDLIYEAISLLDSKNDIKCCSP